MKTTTTEKKKHSLHNQWGTLGTEAIKTLCNIMTNKNASDIARAIAAKTIIAYSNEAINFTGDLDN